MVLEGFVTISIIMMVFFVIILSFFLILRTYWNNIDKLVSYNGEAKLFTKYGEVLTGSGPIILLLTVAFFVTRFSFSWEIDFFNISVSFYSASILVTLVRSVATTPILVKKTDPQAIITALIGVLILTLIVSGIYIVMSGIYQRPEWILFINNIFMERKTDYSFLSIGIYILSLLIPLFFIPFFGELICDLFCRCSGKKREKQSFK